MKKIKAIAVILSVLSATYPITAYSLNMGTGGSTGNYLSMGIDINIYCVDDVSTTINVIESEGSVDNLLGMLTKKFDVGMVQEDVLHFNSEQTPETVNSNRLKIITGLHQEAIHLLIPKSYSPETHNKKMWTDVFTKNRTPKKFELSMLKNQRVGSTGGGLISAEALSYYFDLDLDIYKTSLDVNDTSTPIVLVGGAPYAPVEKYLETDKWILATLDYKTNEKKAGFYNHQTVNYRIDGKIQSISTLGVRSLLIGKSFRKETRNKPMTELATCIYNNISDLADDPETNSNWNNVYDYFESGDQSSWPYFPLDHPKLKK